MKSTARTLAYAESWEPCGPLVGRSNISERYNGRTPQASDANWKWWRVNIARKMGGFWYSTTSAGDCERVDADKECYWKLLATTSRISSACLIKRMKDAIEAYDPTCFRACPQPLNTTGQCAAGCYMDSFLSKRARSSLIGPKDGMPNQIIKAAWRNAFAKQGGCPQM